MALFTPPPLPPQRRPAPPPSLTVAGPSTGSISCTSTVAAVGIPPGVGSVACTSTVAAVGAPLATGTGSISATSTVAAIPASSSIFPLTISSDGRYLKKSDGTPFLICGDTTWSLFVDIPLADLSTFLTNITAKGFNAVSGNAIEHHYTTVKPPKERGGNLPFTKRLDGATYTGTPNGCSGTNGTQGQFAADNYSNINNQAPDPTFPNNTYWQACETILDACLAHNVAVFVWPGYLGFHANDEGWMQEMVAWDAVTGAGGFTGLGFANATKSKMWNYGAWLADRWKNYPHIIWVMGGDYGSGSQTLDTQQKAAVESLMAGLKSVTSAQSVFYTAHWDRISIATDTALTAGSFDINGSYCGEEVAETTRRAYAHSPTSPAMVIEYFYEDDLFGGSVPYRKYMYWGFLSSIAGGLFGQEQLWRFDDGTPGTDYTTLLATQGTLDAQRQFAFWNARPWHRLRPNGLGSIGTLITAGGGTASPQSTTYVTAAATPEGDLLLAYIPPDHTGSVTIDMTKVSSMVTARWFDPTNSAFTVIGSFGNTGTHAFTPPANNNAGDTDFLLVLETPVGAAAGTSTVAGVGQALATGTGTAAGTSTVTGVGQSTAVSTGTITCTSTVAGASLATLTGTGTCAATSTVAGIGQALATGTGTSTGTSTVAGVGQSLATGTGTAAGTGAVSGVGSALALATGSAAGTGAAVGVGGALVVGTGTVACTSTVSAIGSSLVNGQGTGTAAGTSTATGVGQALATGTGTAAAVGTASAVGQSIAVSTGTASGTAAASGVGAALAVSTGTSAGTAIVTGAGSALATSTGSVTCTSTVAGVGSAVQPGTGTGLSVCTSTVSGVGQALVVATGTAASTSTVTGVPVSSIGVGAAFATSTCTAVGGSLATAAGLVTCTSTATAIGGTDLPPGHVRITGVSPDPEVYDYGGSPPPGDTYELS